METTKVAERVDAQQGGLDDWRIAAMDQNGARPLNRPRLPSEVKYAGKLLQPLSSH